MEKSFMCSEQVSQMQAQYDAFALVKIAYDAGCDLKGDPFKFYCYDFGAQISVFWECMKRIFGEVEQTEEGYSEHGSTVVGFRVPLPELKAFYPLLRNGEQEQYVTQFNAMMSVSDDYYGEFEMTGVTTADCLHITLNGEWGLYSPLLEQLVAIRNQVREQIRIRRAQYVNGLQIINLIKMVYDRLGIAVETSIGEHVNVVFSRIMQRCSTINIALDPSDSFSYDAMIKMIDSTILVGLEVEISKNRKGVAA